MRWPLHRGAAAVAIVAVVLNAGCGDGAVRAARPDESATSTALVSSSTSTSTSTSTTAPNSTTVAPAAAVAPGPVEVPGGVDLYANPPAVTGIKPGTLLRYQRLDPFPGAPGALWRVMYTAGAAPEVSEVVTGMVRVPAGAPPVAGWPTISWAHGTTGSADHCAPSRALDYLPVPDPMVGDGFVVTSTDYPGLGTPGLHPYLDGATEGGSVVDIVEAAAQLPGVVLSGDYAVWGHSQGGHAAVFARELAASRSPQRRLVGTVAIAPPALLRDSLTAVLTLQPKGFAALALAGIASRHPDARLSDILVQEAISAIDQTIETGCKLHVDQALMLFGASNVVVAPPNAVEPWRTLLDRSEPAMTVGSGPLLLVHAVDDRTVPEVMSAVVKDRTCGRGEPTLRWLNTSGGHSGVVGDTYPAIRQWVLDRFAGVPAPTNCGTPDGPSPR